MTTLPHRVYLTRKVVAAALGGRRQLELAEAEGRIRRVSVRGYKIAHYYRAEVVALLSEKGALAVDRPFP